MNHSQEGRSRALPTAQGHAVNANTALVEAEAPGIKISNININNNNNTAQVNNKQQHRGPDGIIVQPSHAEDDEVFVKGEVQPDEYRDLNFARLFYLQLLGILITSIYFIPYAFFDSTNDNDSSNSSSSTASTNKDDDEDDFKVTSFAILLTVIFGASLVIIMGFLSLMIQQSHRIVPVSFVLSPALLMMVAILSVLYVGTDAAFHLLLWAVLYALICACVYQCYKRYIPFAASTLHTALTAIEYNKGLLLLSGVFLVINFGWILLIGMTLVGIQGHADAQGTVPCSQLGLTPQDGYPYGSMCDKNPPNVFAILILVFGLYWTQQVIRNVHHCTTAGTVASWWFSPPLADPALFSQHTTDSLKRSLTYSFGSICFGSLLVAIMQTLEQMAYSARRNRRTALLACILECILHILRRWLEYMNSWAFVYVALYGYDYLTAGKNVMELFQNRGWSSFIADRLVFRVLHSVYLGVGLTCGMIAALTDAMIGPVFGPDDNTDTTNNQFGSSSSYSSSSSNTQHDQEDTYYGSHFGCFFLGLFVGLLFAGVAMFVVESAVRTVIVCFAESPGEFQEHHPELCQEMCQGWSQSYPEQWESTGFTNNNNNSQQLPRATVIEQPLMYKTDETEQGGGNATSSSGNGNGLREVI